MAETKIVELKITTNIPDASKKIENLKTNLDGAKGSTKELKKETESVTGGGFDKLGGSLSKLSPAFKSGIEGAKSLGTQLLTLAANPVGAIIIAVVGSLTLLYKAFTSTKAGGEALDRVMAGIGAAMDVLRDRVLAVGGAIAKFFSGDFKGALADARGAVSGIGSEIEKEFKQAGQAKKYLQEVDDALRSLSISRAKLNRDLAKSKEIITDENASYAQKKKAIEEVKIAEEKQTQAELKNAEKKLKAIKLANSLSDTSKADLEKEAQAEAELYALQEKSATDRRAIRKTEIRANKEEEARIKAIQDERNAIAKVALDKEKEDKLKAIADKKKEDEDYLKSVQNRLKTEKDEIDGFNANIAELDAQDKAKKEEDRQADINAQVEAGKTLETQFEKRKAISEADRALTLADKNAKIQAAEEVVKTLDGVANLLGKSTVAGKAAAVASATISTFLSAQKAYESTVGIPIVGPVLAPINAGLAIAGGLKSIKSILAVKVPNGGGGGGSVPSVQAPQAGQTQSATPQFNVVGTSGANQIAQTLGNQAPVKAYVVSNDVTTAQSLDRNIVKTATLGG